MSLIHLEIVTPGRIVFDEEVKSFTAPGIEGSFQILPNHAPFITTIIPGEVKLVNKSDDTDYYVTSGGTVEVHDNKITMLAESIIPAGEINVKEAEQEMLDAQNLLDSKEPGIDKEAAKHRLLTAKAKLKAAAN
jgi:F-type H+-transporting ATPase subunit epsilon